MAYNIAPAYLKASNNLSDLPNKATARINLGVAIGTDVEAWSAQLDSAAAIASNGFVSRSAANTFTPRTFQAGSNKVTISNPTGAAGNPAFDVVPANFSHYLNGPRLSKDQLLVELPRMECKLADISTLAIFGSQYAN